MKSITEESSAQVIIKKSKFIAHLCEFSRFKERLLSLKKEHIKAVHFVYAYRFLNEFHQIIEDKSDDGEPRGSSGQSALSVLRGGGLINVAIIIVRYFGGVKLGVGGLVRAYTEATNEALRLANTYEFEPKASFSLELELAKFEKIKHFCLKNQLEFSPEFGLKSVLLLLKLNNNEEQNFKKFLEAQHLILKLKKISN